MPEKQNIEYKQSWQDEYLKWVCGFANAIGGTIFIGKNDNGKVVDLEDYKSLMEDTPQVTPQVRKLLSVMTGEHNRQDLQDKLQLADRENFRINYLQPALENKLIEMTIPDKPRSSMQMYKLTELGKRIIEIKEGKIGNP